MSREHDRIPATVEVRYRTASSFLFAYSVNLSKGGLFLETDQVLAVGSALTLKLTIPGAGTYEVSGHVTWVRDEPDPDGEGPVGMGLEFDQVDAALGAVIDQLVTGFEGLTVLLFGIDNKDRAALARKVRSIVSTADVAEAGGVSTAEALLSDELDLVVIDADTDSDEGEGWLVLRAALNRDKPIPVIVLAASQQDRERARELGAADAAPNPPSFSELQDVLLRSLGRPSGVGL